MPRNIARDEIREQERRSRMIEAGFRLFSEKTIESVTLQQVADEAGVSIATLYSYYQNKVNLAIAISAAKWGTCWRNAHAAMLSNCDTMNAMDWLIYYCDSIIGLYHNRPELLRFSSNFKTYICHEKTPHEALRDQYIALRPMQENFLWYYEKAKTDHSIRTDLPVDEMFTTIAHTMLTMAERYAIGLVWADNNTTDHTAELQHLKDMLVMWCKGA